jgi:hypothetical protein
MKNRQRSELKPGPGLGLGLELELEPEPELGPELVMPMSVGLRQALLMRRRKPGKLQKRVRCRQPMRLEHPQGLQHPRRRRWRHRKTRLLRGRRQEKELVVSLPQPHQTGLLLWMLQGLEASLYPQIHYRQRQRGLCQCLQRKRQRLSLVPVPAPDRTQSPSQTTQTRSQVPMQTQKPVRLVVTGLPRRRKVQTRPELTPVPGQEALLVYRNWGSHQRHPQMQQQTLVVGQCQREQLQELRSRNQKKQRRVPRPD